VVKAFRSRTLKRFYEKDDTGGVAPEHVDKVRRILTLLDAAAVAGDMKVPGMKLHPLKGDLKGHWSVTVSGNWRITWRFEGSDVVDVDYLDYH
jgi:proteic killer suppression protein